MNLTQQPTVDELAALLAQCDDKAGHHVVWVAHNGDVHITLIDRQGDDPGHLLREQEPNIRFKWEAYIVGNGYVGPEAAADAAHVAGMLRELLEDWATGQTGFVTE